MDGSNGNCWSREELEDKLQTGALAGVIVSAFNRVKMVDGLVVGAAVGAGDWAASNYFFCEAEPPGIRAQPITPIDISREIGQFRNLKLPDNASAEEALPLLGIEKK